MDDKMIEEILEILEIYAFYPMRTDDARTGATHYRRLAIRLEELSPWLSDLRADRKNVKGGRDVKSQGFPDEFAEWKRKFLERYPDEGEGHVIAATTPDIVAQRGQKISAFVSYSWGSRGSHDTVHISIPIPAAGRDDAIPLLRRIVRVLAEWRPCLFMASLPSDFKFEGRTFEDRVSSGTGIWTTQDLTGIDLSAAYLVEPVMNGTLILPVDHVFTYDDKQSHERIAELDGHLAEQGILPFLRDMGYSL